MQMARLGKSLLVLATVAIFATACASGPSDLQYPPGKTLKVTRQVWSYYQEYLATLGGSTPGVFLVAMDGDVARGARYMYCPVQYERCSAKGGGPVNETNRMCIKDHLTCVLFARNSLIQVPYEIID